MTKFELAQQALKQSDGIARTVDLKAAGLSNIDICALCSDGYLERIRHGYYMLAGNVEVSEEQLLATLVPEGVVSTESALFYYGYSDFTPRIWTITVPRTISRAKLQTEVIPLKAYFVSSAIYPLGKTVSDFNGVALAVYDRERTICDCFKHRSKLDSEMFSKALHAYVEDNKKNLSLLSKYAKEMRLYKKVNELMEVLLNG